MKHIKADETKDFSHHLIPYALLSNIFQNGSVLMLILNVRVALESGLIRTYI